jgi:hypothetical protein
MSRNIATLRGKAVSMLQLSREVRAAGCHFEKSYDPLNQSNIGGAASGI